CVFDGLSYPRRVQILERLNTTEHEQLRTVHVIRGEGGVGRSSRQAHFSPGRVNDESFVPVSIEDAADIANVVHQTSYDEMRVIVGRSGGEQRPAPHDIVPDQGHEHCVLDIVVERVTVADAFQRKPRDRWNRVACVRTAKSALYVRGEK